MESMKKITLFLDIDGVLHPHDCGESRFFECSYLLMAVLAQHPNIDIVISSTWRLDFPELDDLRARIEPPELRARIVGVTPSLPQSPSQYRRQNEIELYAQQHALQKGSFFAIDDQIGNFSPTCPWLLLVHGNKGLTEDHVVLITKYINRLLAQPTVNRKR